MLPRLNLKTKRRNKRIQQNMITQIALFCCIALLYVKFLDGFEIKSVKKSEIVKKLKAMRDRSVSVPVSNSQKKQNSVPVPNVERISPEILSSFFDRRTRSKQDSQFKTTQELILAQGLPFQAHTVTTRDGYILELHRIPANKLMGHKGTIVFQHGFEDSSETWVLNNRTNTMPFILHDAGYDVWLTNSRGNRYARRHQSLSDNDEAFWDFSIEDMIEKDLPASLNYIAHVSNPNSTNPTIRAFFGHSQGGAIGLASFNEERFRSKDLPRIELFVALAPAVYLKWSECIFIKGFKVFTDGELRFAIGKKAFLPDSKLLHYLIPHFCDSIPFVCKNMYALIAGSDFSDVPQERLPFYVAHVPSGTSTKASLQLLQMARTGNFQKFDYGNAKDNMRAYGTERPPIYDIKKLSVPTMLFYGDKDELVSKIGVETVMIPQLKETKQLVLVKEIPEYSHAGFIWAPSSIEKILRNTGL